LKAHGGSPAPQTIFQNLNLLNDERPDYVCVFGADHIYRMDPRQMVEQHATGRGDGGRHPRPSPGQTSSA
jgi:glucose-1-phosphate adenylyltransferase